MMKRPTQRVLKIADEIHDHGDNNMECELWAATQIDQLRQMVRKVAPLVKKYAGHTVEGSQFISHAKQLRLYKDKK